MLNLKYHKFNLYNFCQSDGLRKGKMLDYFEQKVRPSWASLRGSADGAALFVQTFGYCGLANVKTWRLDCMYYVSPRFKSLIKKSLFILIVYSRPLADEVT